MMETPEGHEENWTEEQLEAISLQGKNILVTAGAGSGKTRVLVERLLRRITDRQNPVDLDRLLIVTFTKAAASEMKQRIGIALEKALQQNPRSQSLHRQLLLLNRATITTVHSFCLDVIRRYYYLKELDPSFRVLDEAAAELLRQEILEETLDEYYDSQQPGSSFYRLVEAYSSDRGDQALQSLILRLYSFARSHPFPSQWLQQQQEAFRSGVSLCAAKNPWLEIILDECRIGLQMIVEFIEEGIRIAHAPGGPAPYLETLREELEVLREMRDASHRSWDELFVLMQQNPFGRLKPCRGDAYDADLRERVSQIRERAKGDFYKLRSSYFSCSLQERLAELKRLEPLIASLVELVEVFSRRYMEAKKEKGVADFSDLEHFALQILNCSESPPGTLSPSQAALEYRNFFTEIMVDEYQDINQVQEAILTLIASPRPHGNLFMVGDVKQSIYRFRLAEPELFLQKEHLYSRSSSAGCCIHLNKNFRSRKEILEGVNFLFSRIMDEAVGEIGYDGRARLYYGGLYPPYTADGHQDNSIDFLLIHRFPNESPEERAPGASEEEPEGEAEQHDNQEEWEAASLEGKLIAQKIKQLLGETNSRPFMLYDRKKKSPRAVTYRDIAILLRSAKNYAPAILEELQQAGIPAFAELGGGFFDAVEVKVMLSLLAVIDNPFQDLPLAAVLRSPILGFKGEELALIRTASPSTSFFDALRAASKQELIPLPRRKELQQFLQNLERWQEQAVRGSIEELIRQIYRETGYYSLVGGMPGGRQRQANLRALYDRARLYEASSPRGLFRFLNFIEKLKDRGEDLEAARALGEQENVVRILTIHKSKGLEFPVVILAGINRAFNKKDLNHHFLLHKELGFGPKYIDTENRLIYPTLPWFAIKKRLHAELLAEEMRILYVAMTRAEEKLILVATINNLEEELLRWKTASRPGAQFLPEYFRARAKCFLDWIGPAIACHPKLKHLQETTGLAMDAACAGNSGILSWNVFFYTPSEIVSYAVNRETEALQEGDKERQEYLGKIYRMEPLPLSGDETAAAKVSKYLSWQYPYLWATKRYAKVSVSELPKLRAAGLVGNEGEFAPEAWGQGSFIYLNKRPRFLEDKLTAAERGTAYHTVMQHLKLIPPLNAEAIRQQLQQLLSEKYLNLKEYNAVDPELIAAFFATSPGKRLVQAYPSRIWRELPFTLALPATEIYCPGDKACCPEAEQEYEQQKDPVLIQGVIDCIFMENDAFILIDYKTGIAPELETDETRVHYSRQLYYYSLAIEKIWRKPVSEKYLYFFDSGQLLQL
ncbi:MAG: helicase-exonuclease AddAB subunit AddA [Firmicutes bacterium]|nr:helicase-exonuclease AddAB subunit AddA [Bacillota bacterium]